MEGIARDAGCEVGEVAISCLRIAISQRFRSGMPCADIRAMGVRHVEDLRAFQHARAFKCEVYALVRASPDANADFKYRSQLCESAASAEMNIAEGWRRFGAGEIAQFLRFSRASLEEAEHRLRDGVDRGYFTREACGPAFNHARKCGAATMALWKSLQPFMKKARGPGKP